MQDAYCVEIYNDILNRTCN